MKEFKLIQRQINELIRLCQNASRSQAPHTSESDKLPPHAEDFTMLILCLLDGELSRRQFQKFEYLLLSSPEMMDYYLEFITLSTQLFYIYNSAALPAVAAAP